MQNPAGICLNLSGHDCVLYSYSGDRKINLPQGSSYVFFSNDELRDFEDNANNPDEGLYLSRDVKIAERECTQ